MAVSETYFTRVVKKLSFVGAGEKIFKTKEPESDDKLTTIHPEDLTILDVNQFFNGIFINNVSTFNCYFSVSDKIVASPSAVDQVQILLPNDGAFFEVGNYDTLRVYLGGAGDIYITLFSQ